MAIAMVTETDQPIALREFGRLYVSMFVSGQRAGKAMTLLPQDPVTLVKRTRIAHLIFFLLSHLLLWMGIHSKYLTVTNSPSTFGKQEKKNN